MGKTLDIRVRQRDMAGIAGDSLMCSRKRVRRVLVLSRSEPRRSEAADVVPGIAFTAAASSFELPKVPVDVTV